MLVKLYSALGAVQHAVSPHMQEIGYFEKQALQAMGAKGYRTADYEKDSEILGQIQNIYNLEGITQLPKVILYEQDIPNAAFIHTGTIVVSTGLLKRLNKDEREGVLAHEITHQKQNGVNLSVFGAYLATTLVGTTLLTNKIMNKAPAKLSGSLMNYLTFGAVGYIVNLATSIPFFAHKRHQEYKADEGAAWITRKPEALASALRELEKPPEGQKDNAPKIAPTDGNIPMAALHNNANTHEEGLQGLKHKLYASHPSTDKRDVKLKNIEIKQRSMGMHHSQLNPKKGATHEERVVKLSEESRASSSQLKA